MFRKIYLGDVNPLCFCKTDDGYIVGGDASHIYHLDNNFNIVSRTSLQLTPEYIAKYNDKLIMDYQSGCLFIGDELLTYKGHFIIDMLLLGNKLYFCSHDANKDKCFTYMVNMNTLEMVLLEKDNALIISEDAIIYEKKMSTNGNKYFCGTITPFEDYLFGGYDGSVTLMSQSLKVLDKWQIQKDIIDHIMPFGKNGFVVYNNVNLKVIKGGKCVYQDNRLCISNLCVIGDKIVFVDDEGLHELLLPCIPVIPRSCFDIEFKFS